MADGGLGGVAGTAEPLGASPAGGGVNFALSAPAASSVLLCLFDESGAPLGEELPLAKGASGVWSLLVEGCPPAGVLYGCAAAAAAATLRAGCRPGGS